MNPTPYFDAHVIAPSGELKLPPEQLYGAILFGAGAPSRRDQLAMLSSERNWLSASGVLRPLPLSSRGEGTGGGVSEESIESPHRNIVRLHLTPDDSVAVYVRRHASKFSQTRFIVDPFIYGPAAAWQAHVRVAECENIWLTTLGILPGATPLWPDANAVREALYFLVGEVGAGKLLVASGMTWKDITARPSAPAQWIAGFDFIDDAERALVLSENARNLVLG